MQTCETIEEKREVFDAFSRALVRESHNLMQRPDLLWQQLYNRLQWEKEPVTAVLQPEYERRTAPGAALWLRARTPFRESEALIRVLAGHIYTVGLKSDSTVVTTKGYSAGTGGWTDVIQVAAGYGHTVGLKSDGTVVAAGWDNFGQCDVDSWTGIIQVAAGTGEGGGHTVGLESDGTVVAVGNNISGQCDVGNWTDIVQVAAGGCHTVGLKSDGTVVAVGASGLVIFNDYGQCDVGNWTDIIQIAAGGMFFGGHTVGVKTNGTVVAAGPEIALSKRNLGVIEYALTIFQHRWRFRNHP